MWPVATDVHVARSVSICLCWALGWAVWKRLNQSRCRLGGGRSWLMWVQVTMFSMGVQIPTWSGTFEGDMFWPSVMFLLPTHGRMCLTSKCGRRIHLPPQGVTRWHSILLPDCFGHFLTVCIGFRTFYAVWRISAVDCKSTQREL